jgi:hypothetical protein
MLSLSGLYVVRVQELEEARCRVLPVKEFIMRSGPRDVFSLARVLVVGRRSEVPPRDPGRSDGPRLRNRRGLRRQLEGPFECDGETAGAAEPRCVLSSGRRVALGESESGWLRRADNAFRSGGRFANRLRPLEPPATRFWRSTARARGAEAADRRRMPGSSD